MREADAGRARNVFDHGTPSYPIHFEMRNVTFYNYCDGRRMVDLNNSGAGSVAIFENVLIASNAADPYRTSGNTERTTTNIYGTSEYTRNRQATILEVSANDLFRDPTQRRPDYHRSHFHHRGTRCRRPALAALTPLPTPC